VFELPSGSGSRSCHPARRIQACPAGVDPVVRYVDGLVAEVHCSAATDLAGWLQVFRIKPEYLVAGEAGLDKPTAVAIAKCRGITMAPSAAKAPCGSAICP
jgi:hypothetical protein